MPDTTWEVELDGEAASTYLIALSKAGQAVAVDTSDFEAGMLQSRAAMGLQHLRLLSDIDGCCG